ncbi:MAG TPA: DUF2207 domain-containing protein [Longimicrobium sp.]|nr:DUF2207 domain-containing protein [Longimicrobium sp.]
MRSLLTLGVVLLALAAPLHAQERSIRIRDFDALLTVGRDGGVDVTERLTIGFTGQWKGLNRDLLLRHVSGQGRKEVLDLEVTSVTDGDGKPMNVEMEDLGDGWTKRLRIYVPGASDAERQIVIRYHVSNAIRFFYEGSETGAMDELYWNVTGSQWDMPIDRAHGRVVLPAGARARQAEVYTGPEGTKLAGSHGVSRVTESGVEFASARPLQPFEGVTVAVGWPPGFVATRPSDAAHRTAEAVRLWPLALPLLAFGLGFRAWRRRGRDPREESIVVQYEPPASLTPAEAGTLIDHTAEMRDITATLVDMAVRGYIGIEERTEKTMMGLFTSTDFVFYRRRSRKKWSELAEHEQLYLTALFEHATHSDESWEEVRAHAHADGDEPEPESRGRSGRGSESVMLSDLSQKFYVALPGIRDALYTSLMERGYYRSRPDKVKNLWFALAAVVLVVCLVGAFIAFDSTISWVSAGALAAGGMGSAIILFIFSRIMPARTSDGARAREAALGFREFLSRVESDRYRKMITSPEMFEQYLPYAMAFGVEGRWARAFEDIYREPPQWYRGSGTGRFHATGFSQRMSAMSSTAGSTMSSSPSSSSSGSGGGGSSGGGSGGGGGSGF